MTDPIVLKSKIQALMPILDERQRRLYAGSEAMALGRGGIEVVVEASGLSRNTVIRGMRELEDGIELSVGRARREGGGAKHVTATQPGLMDELRRLVEPATRGDPESLLRWVSKGLRPLSEALKKQGFKVSFRTVADLLRLDHFNLQANSKVLDGTDNPDRDAQFHHISQKAKHFMEAKDPVISVDTKKKELVGQFKNAGREWTKQGFPEKTLVHDFVGSLGRVSPYGVYDISANAGWVGVGISHDTAEFAVRTIRRWHGKFAATRYPGSAKLYVCCDGGGSNGSRLRLWKSQLQKFCDETEITVSVSHYSPGTSKWNLIEHRMFSFITMNWRAHPLADYMTILSLIGATTTDNGLKIECELDTTLYDTGIHVSDEEMDALKITRDEFRGEWNYTIEPHNSSPGLS